MAMSVFSEHRSKGKRSRIDYALSFSPSPLKKLKSQFRPFDLLKSFTPSSSYARDCSVAMGNLLSLVFGKSKASNSHDSSENVLGFHEYKSLVVGETPKSDPRLVTRKGLDARSIVERVPVYKRLYEATRQRDERLSGLKVEVKSTEDKLLDLRIAAHIIQVEDEGEEEEENLYDVFCPLTDEDENEVHDALYSRDSHTILVTHENSNIEITQEIIRCLRPGGWLNDEVINLYLELLKERERRQPERFLKCHFFNSFFYKKLIGGNGRYDYKAVKRWTTQKKLGYSLIDCDKIFVPVHKNIHWCLAVINVKQKSLQYLDSLGGMDPFVLSVLAKYLVDEARDKRSIEMDVSSWSQETISLPMQQNGYDCGMFMLKYIDFYSRGLSLSFSQENMEYFRKRTVKEILRLRAE